MLIASCSVRCRTSVVAVPAGTLPAVGEKVDWPGCASRAPVVVSNSSTHAESNHIDLPPSAASRVERFFLGAMVASFAPVCGVLWPSSSSQARHSGSILCTARIRRWR
jgi:hypothetical protein